MKREKERLNGKKKRKKKKKKKQTRISRNINNPITNRNPHMSNSKLLNFIQIGGGDVVGPVVVNGLKGICVSSCGVWCVVCGVWCVVCGVWCVVCGVWCVVCGVWCVVCGVWCVVCGVWCGELLVFVCLYVVLCVFFLW